MAGRDRTKTASGAEIKRSDKIEPANQPRSARAKEKQESTEPQEYRVAPNHTYTLGQLDEESGEVRYLIYGPGETVKVPPKLAKEAPWALMPAERRRSHPGQTSRLQREVETLRARIRELESGGSKSKVDEKGREEALKSIQLRGDMHALRGEPTPHVAERSTIDAYESAQDAEYVAANRDLPSDDEATGVPGAARQTVDSPEGDANAEVVRGQRRSEPGPGGPEGLDDEAERTGTDTGDKS